MERYTRKDAEKALDRLIKALGKRATKFDHSPEDIGSYYLDYNATYGGCMVHEVDNAGYGVNTPFGTSRCNPYEFCHRIEFAIRAMGVGMGVGRD